LVGSTEQSVALFLSFLVTSAPLDLSLPKTEQYSVTAAQGGPQDQSSGGRDHARERMEEFLRQRMPQNEETEEFLRQHLPQDDTAGQQGRTKQKPSNDDQGGDSGPQP
jgi:hypothetical protein